MGLRRWSEELDNEVIYKTDACDTFAIIYPGIYTAVLSTSYLFIGYLFIGSTHPCSYLDGDVHKVRRSPRTIGQSGERECTTEVLKKIRSKNNFTLCFQKVNTMKPLKLAGQTPKMICKQYSSGFPCRSITGTTRLRTMGAAIRHCPGSLGRSLERGSRD